MNPFNTRWILAITMVLMMWPAFGQDASRLFPLGRSMAGDRDLPLPFGLGVTFYSQQQDYALDQLAVDVPIVNPEELEGIEVTNSVDELNLRIDAWLLPFLNVFGIVGQIDGKTAVDLVSPLPGFSVDYSGMVYGGGITLAAGGETCFGSLSATYTATDLDQSNSDVKAWYVVPKFGLRRGQGAFWVGATYETAEEAHEGQLVLPFYGAVNYDVVLHEQDHWNSTLGISADFAKSWNLVIEGGLGNRTHVLATVTRRF